MSQAKTISTEEFNRLLLRLGRSRNAVRNQTMIYITHWSGMRVGEIASLKIKDVINKDGSIKSEVHLAASQTKGNSSRSVMVPKKLQDALMMYIATIWTTNDEYTTIYWKQVHKANNFETKIYQQARDYVGFKSDQKTYWMPLLGGPPSPKLRKSSKIYELVKDFSG